MNQPFAALLAGIAIAIVPASPRAVRAQQAPPTVKLPDMPHQGAMSVEAALWARHSTRGFTRDSIALADLGRLLWAAQGVNRPNSHRTAPSAMATYPLELYVVASRVRDLPAGVYRYRPMTHEVERVAGGDKLPELVSSAVRSAWIGDAAVVFVFAADQGRATRLRDRAERWMGVEVGAAAQNLALEAAALDLGGTFVGSADDAALARIVGLPASQRPMGLVPVGRPR